MKWFWIAAVCMVLRADAAEPPQAPVNVATSLYQGCVQSAVDAARDIEPTRVGINEFVNSVDDNCLGWTIIWFRTGFGYDLADRPDLVSRFTLNRLRLLQQLTNGLREQALK